MTEDTNKIQSGIFEHVANKMDVGRRSSFQECSAEQPKENITKDKVFCRSTSEYTTYLNDISQIEDIKLKSSVSLQLERDNMGEFLKREYPRK